MPKRCCTAIFTAVAEGSLKAIDAEFGYFGQWALISVQPWERLTTAACRAILAFGSGSGA
jgi:hypothetical protein